MAGGKATSVASGSTEDMGLEHNGCQSSGQIARATLRQKVGLDVGPYGVLIATAGGASRCILIARSPLRRQSLHSESRPRRVAQAKETLPPISEMIETTLMKRAYELVFSLM